MENYEDLTTKLYFERHVWVTDKRPSKIYLKSVIKTQK